MGFRGICPKCKVRPRSVQDSYCGPCRSDYNREYQRRKRDGRARVFTSGSCAICRLWFVSANSNGVCGKYCSKACERKGYPKARIRGVSGTILKRLRAAPCAYCESPAVHIDHVVPRSKSGPDAEWNLVGACFDCNVSKSNRSLYSFLLEDTDRLACFLAA
jgi:5-methylcytosine-specific restriction endonuclease McrA